MAGALPAPAQCADKAALRKRLLAARRAIDPARKILWDREIGARLLAWSQARALPALAVYWPISGEPDLTEAYAELARRGVRLALPVVTARAAPLAFAEWLPGEAMDRDQMGVAVPAALRLLARPGAIALPCVGFNAQRFRLGYGGGYYDRTLEAAPRPFALGIAYAQLEAGFEHGAHDIALDLIITEAGPACI
ncbi:MAG: 5-formyltetrahydrofolate cyclo-ligase [Pseudomonadota bacterium]